MHIAVMGAGGRLGTAVCHEFRSAGHRVAAFAHTDLDVTDAAQVAGAIERLHPDAIINCSAYNAVDAAETEADAAFALNAHGPALLREAAAACDAPFVHFSTDFVFDGRAAKPYGEADTTNPLGVYGASKLAGEVEVARTPRHYILRVASLFGGSGVRGHRATVDQIADTLLAGGQARALVDRTVSPSYVPDVAWATRMLLEREAPYGTYHCVSGGATTWYELALLVARLVHVPACVEPLLASQLKTRAPRPLFCALSNRKLREIGVELPGWQSALRRHLMARVDMPISAVS